MMPNLPAPRDREPNPQCRRPQDFLRPKRVRLGALAGAAWPRGRRGLREVPLSATKSARNAVAAADRRLS